MLLERNVVGNQQDWAQFVTTSDEHETPILDMLPKGNKPVNVLHQYQADKYSEPMPVAKPDGQDWSTFKSAAENRVELKARVQWFENTCAVSKLAQDVSNAAGVRDELAREIPKKLKEMARSIEATFGSDQAAYEDDGVTGNKTQGMGLWIQSGTTNQLYPTPASVRPAAAQIVATTFTLTQEPLIRAALAAAWTATGRKGRMIGFVGAALKSRFAEFSLFSPAVANVDYFTRSNRDYKSREIGAIIDVYSSDFGIVELYLDAFLAHPNFGGSLDEASWRGYFIHPDMWQIRWNQKPQVYKPEFQGGSYKAAMDAIVMLVCLNPIGEVKIDPTGA